MKIGGLFLGLVICLFTITAKADEPGTPGVGIADVEDFLINFSHLEEDNLALDKLQYVLNTLAKKQEHYKRERDFVEYIYYFTHRRLLKKYNQYASLSATLKSGEYDCLTATTIYSILLTELSVPHAIVETNYHIYILIYPDSGGEILLEATNPHNGLISNAEVIKQLKVDYKSTNYVQEVGQVKMSLNIERRLDGKELIGLLYYNQSVKELNLGNWQKAEKLANMARTYYPNVRITSLIEFIDTSYRSASI